MTPEHRKYLNYNKEDFTGWAISVGTNTAKVVAYFLTAGKEAEQGYKACASLTKLEERYGQKKLEAACCEVLRYSSSPSIRLISTVIKGSSCPSESKPDEGKTLIPNYSNAHGITRGAAYYSRSGKAAKNGKGGESK